MAKLGLKGFNAIIDNHFEKIPDEYFRSERLVPKPLETEGHRQARKERERAKRNSSKTGKTAEEGGAGSRGRGANDRSHSHSHSTHRRSRHRSDSRDSANSEDSNNSEERLRGSQDQEHKRSNYPPQQTQFVQGDPNFPSNHGNYQPPQPGQDQQSFISSTNPPYDPYAGSDYYAGQTQSRGASPQMNDQYYAPPPPGGGYQRYDPSNYRPQGAGSEDRYTPASYQNSSSSNQAGQNGAGQDRYNDRDSDGSADERDRRGRKDKKSGRHKTSRSTSPTSPRDKFKGVVNKHLDTSTTGMEAGAIGALAGALLGHKVFKGPISAVAGGLIGGLGANAWEARDHKSKERRRSSTKHKEAPHHRARSEGHRGSRDDRDSYRSDSDDQSPRDRRRSSRRDQGSDEESEDSDYDRKRRERRSRKGKSRDAEKIDRDPAMKWNTTLQNPAD